MTSLETLCMSILLKIRASLRGAVKEFKEVNYSAEGIHQRLVYEDGKTYEITIKEMKDGKDE